MIRHPPASTLFPNTTLIRSRAFPAAREETTRPPACCMPTWASRWSWAGEDAGQLLHLPGHAAAAARRVGALAPPHTQCRAHGGGGPGRMEPGRWREMPHGARRPDPHAHGAVARAWP